jgi:hypothetical protein
LVQFHEEQIFTTTFSDHAYEKLIDLFNNHDHEVGSELKKEDPTKYKDYKSTDCITYALNVIRYAFEKVGDAASAKKAWSLGKYGTELAKYLVDSHGWSGVYINPDTVHPVDAQQEHTYSNYVASKSCSYHKVPVAYKVTNFNVTPNTHAKFQKLNKTSPVTTLNTVDIASLKLVKFGFGISRGGMHTWLFSYGKVYEVHWKGIGADLYEATPLELFGWLSGAIVVPKDQVGHLAVSAKLKCG